MTRTILNTQEAWLKHREIGIGGSDCGCIVGANPYKSALDLWKEKIDYRHGIKPPFIENAFTQYGKTCEPAIRTIFQANFVDYFKVYNNPLESLRDDEYNFMKASLDGEITVLKDITVPEKYGFNKAHSLREIELKEGMKGVHEIKTCDITFHPKKFKGPYGIPESYLCQIMHYLMITQYDFACCTALLQTKNDKGIIIKNEIFNYFYLRKDLDFLIANLREQEVAFWDCVLKEEMPKIIF